MAQYCLVVLDVHVACNVIEIPTANVHTGTVVNEIHGWEMGVWRRRNYKYCCERSDKCCGDAPHYFFTVLVCLF
jgi:hypothetical protein